MGRLGAPEPGALASRELGPAGAPRSTAAGARPRQLGACPRLSGLARLELELELELGLELGPGLPAGRCHPSAGQGGLRAWGSGAAASPGPWAGWSQAGSRGAPRCPAGSPRLPGAPSPACCSVSAATNPGLSWSSAAGVASMVLGQCPRGSLSSLRRPLRLGGVFLAFSHSQNIIDVMMTSTFWERWWEVSSDHLMTYSGAVPISLRKDLECILLTTPSEGKLVLRGWGYSNREKGVCQIHLSLLFLQIFAHFF